MADNKALKRVPTMYLVSNFAQSFGVTVPMTYLIFFMTDFALITPAIMAAIMLISRIVDLVFSFAAGGIIQKTQMKWGQFRSWLMVVPPIVLIGAFLSFLNPNIPLMGKAIIIGIGYVLTNVPMNFIVAAQYGLMAKVSGGSVDTRMKISARTMQGMNAGMLLCSLITLPLIMAFNKMGFANGYLIVATLFGVFNVLGQFFLFKATKEFDAYNPNLKNVVGSSANVKTSSMIIDTIKNSQIIMLLGVDILRNTGLFTLSSMMTYYFSYVVGNFELMTVALTVQSVVGLAAAIIMPPVARKIGKKNSSILSGFLAGGAYLCLALFAKSNPVIYIACCAVGAAGFAIVGSCGANLYLDAAEYQLYRTGKDNRPFAMSLMNVPMKVGMALSSLTVAAILIASGQDAATATMANPNLFVLLVGLLPAALYAISGVIMIFFKINEAKSREYAAHNQRVMEERMKSAAEAPAQGPAAQA